MTPEPTDSPELESSLPLQGERVALTGTLASMTHEQALGLIQEQGGQPQKSVSGQTTLLVVGEEGWPLEDDGRVSVKLRQAREWIEHGHSLRILSEADWLKLVGLEEGDRQSARLHTPSMLQQLLDIPVGVIRRWERLELIRAKKRVFRLPYFDFEEVAAVQKLKRLLDAGVPRAQIETSLTGLRSLFASVERSLAQLDILARNDRVVYRDSRGLLDPRRGQRLFDFEADADDNREGDSVALPMLDDDSAVSQEAVQRTWSADDWFEQGCQLLEEDNTDGAIEAFRLAVMDRPEDPELHFHLADALFRSNNRLGAQERYHTAVELDHDYIAAWTQLACVRHQLEDSQGALDALDIALSIHGQYAEAVFHKAEILADTGRRDEAIPLWREYLKLDRRGPWAGTARQQLELSAESKSEREALP